MCTLQQFALIKLYVKVLLESLFLQMVSEMHV